MKDDSVPNFVTLCTVIPVQSNFLSTAMPFNNQINRTDNNILYPADHSSCSTTRKNLIFNASHRYYLKNSVWHRPDGRIFYPEILCMTTCSWKVCVLIGKTSSFLLIRVFFLLLVQCGEWPRAVKKKKLVWLQRFLFWITSIPVG